MRRIRTFNAAPSRSASVTVDTVCEVVATSLAASAISTSAVNNTLAAARPALLMLISGRHLKKNPVVLVAGDTICEIYCRYDAEAVSGEENLNAVPGMSKADTFTLYLPAPAPLTSAIEDIATSDSHLTTEPAPSEVKAAVASAGAGTGLDLDVLKDLL